MLVVAVVTPSSPAGGFLSRWFTQVSGSTFAADLNPRVFDEVAALVYARFPRDSVTFVYPDVGEVGCWRSFSAPAQLLE